MKLPLSWLREFVKTNKSAEEIADKLTMAGLEVEEIVSEVIFEGVVVGEVLKLEKHPNADKLRVAKIDVGKDKLQIVCGAPNIAVGQQVPVALVGAKLGDFEIGKATLRGIESSGMVCSEKELGLGENHDGIMVLEKSAKVGEDFGKLIGKDKVLDVKVLANRPDCMSVIGLANEIAAVTKTKINIPPIKLKSDGPEEKFKIEVMNDDLCPRYMARIIRNVGEGDSPKWMQERLAASGVRPISLLVDISNYVMLEYGQPLHFFDLDKLKDKTIIIRPAKAGETLKTLDGVNRKLNPDNLVIANSKEAIALAGVMGGENTEIDKNTKNILIEAAVFDKASIRRTSRALGLRSEAVARFEKGLSQMLPEVAINRAAELLSDLAGGRTSESIFNIEKSKFNFQKINLNPTRLNAFLGTKYTNKDIIDVLTQLGFVVSEKTKYSLEVTVPFWRIDIKEPVDLYEEVARMSGYDKIPSTLPFEVESIPRKNEKFWFKNTIRKQLSGIGFSEIMTYSFASAKELESVGEDLKKAPVLANPLVKEQEYLRTSLYPKMLESLANNQFLADTVRFFEIGKTFEVTKSGKLPKETEYLVVGLLGGTNWPIKSKEGNDFYDLKGSIENLLGSFGLTGLSFLPEEARYFEVGRAAGIHFAGKEIGEIGEVKNGVCGKFGLKKAVAIARINIEELMSVVKSTKVYHEFSKYPVSKRDISAVFPLSAEVKKILEAIESADKLLQNVEITDIYTGKPLAEDEKSVSIRLTIGSFDQTLTDADVELIVKICFNKITKIGGKVRGGAA